jgi:hypothetical protein
MRRLLRICWPGVDPVKGRMLLAVAYTYGPPLGLFAFGQMTHHAARDGPTLSTVFAESALPWLKDSNRSAPCRHWQVTLEPPLNAAMTLVGLRLTSRPRQTG